jgi:DNA-binding response OmpR family regulator
VPPTSDPSVEKSPPRHLLLVEDYDALVVAIGSALGKFAPEHERHVVGSIAEADNVIDQFRPELIAIDLDPPQRGVVQFIERLRVAHPAARLLAIGCGTSPELTAARGSMAGIHFIEKPFALADFGKVVEELTASTESTVGAVADIALPDLIALECIIGTDAVLQVEAAGGRVGEIHFSKGHVVHAIAPGLLDRLAIEEMARWRKCHFAETDRRGDAPRTIHTPWSPLLVDLVRKITPDEAAEPESSVTRRKRRKLADSGKKIVIVDDTELLLEFVEEILSAADPSLQITTAHTGTEGVRRAQLTRPDLVLLDYSLPDINGDEVCKRLLADEETAQIPIVMMSGHLAQMMATAEQYENVVDTIAKPFVSVDFVELVTRTLAKGPPKIVRRPKKAAVAPNPAAPPHKENGQPSARTPAAAAEAQVMPITPAIPPPEATPVVAPPPHLSPPPPPAPPAPPPPRAIPAPAPEPPLRVGARTVATVPRAVSISAAAAAVPILNGRTVLLGIPLETTSIHVTAALKIGHIRARAASRTVSLSFPPETFRMILALQTGFDIEAIEVNDRKQLETISLVPNRRPIELLQTSRRFDVDDVEIAPSEGLDLMPDQTSAMQVQMLAAFRLQSVELSPLFDVSRLVLSTVSRRVRVSLEASTEAPGSIFEVLEVHADAAKNLGELLLSPV